MFAALPKHLPRLMSVGRLDANTEGLLLLTNDGGLGAPPGTAGDRLDAPLPRARARPRGAGAARRAAPGHHHRRRALRPDRGAARARAGRQCLADVCHARGQEPRGQERARPSRARGEPAHSRVVRPVPARRAAGGRGRGGAHAASARAAGREDRGLGGTGFRGAASHPSPRSGEGGPEVDRVGFDKSPETPPRRFAPTLPLRGRDKKPTLPLRGRDKKKPRRDTDHLGEPEKARRERKRGRRPFRGKPR